MTATTVTEVSANFPRPSATTQEIMTIDPVAGTVKVVDAPISVPVGELKTLPELLLEELLELLLELPLLVELLLLLEVLLLAPDCDWTTVHVYDSTSLAESDALHVSVATVLAGRETVPPFGYDTPFKMIALTLGPASPDQALPPQPARVASSTAATTNALFLLYIKHTFHEHLRERG